MHDGVPLPITVTTLRQVINQPSEYWEKIEEDRSKEVAEMFKSTPYEELVAKQKENCRDLNEIVGKVLQSVQEKDAAKNFDSPGGNRRKAKDIFELEFPDLFVY